MGWAAHLRFVTFNVQHGRRPDGVVDVGALAAACASFDADVLALQEVDVNAERSDHRDEAADAGRAAGMSWVFGEAMALGAGGRYGNALLARGAIDDVEVVALPHHPKAEPRSAIVARVTLDDGRALSVAVCHLGLFGEAARQLPAVVGVLRGRPGPHALLGDLNLETDDVRPLVEASGLRLLEPLPTFPAHRPRRCIDHVAVDGLDAAAISALEEQPVSDHRPLAVEIA